MTRSTRSMGATRSRKTERRCVWTANEGADKELGTFSISLAVKDIEASKAFYEKFGFSVSPEISHRIG